MTGALRADHELAFTYRRSVGGAERVFLRGLARAEVWGSVDSGGRVTVPPVDWDPATGAPAEGFVPVADHGVVRSWTWVAQPKPADPLDRSFALALIQLEGSDTSLLHVVDVPDEQDMRTAMPVRADWRASRSGRILDIRAFVPWLSEAHGTPAPAAGLIPGGPISGDHISGDHISGDPPELEVISDVRMRYRFEPGLAQSRFLNGLAERRIRGGRCPACGGVYVPPRSTCPACRRGPMADVDLPDTGTITSFTVVHVPFHGMTIDLPFVCAWIKLDGADVPFAHLIGGTDPAEVQAGRRVRAVWVPDDDLAPTWESIRYFQPTDEPSDDQPAPCRE
jgi:uncharacterized protein